MGHNILQKLQQKDLAKNQAKKNQEYIQNELDMNSVREQMFIISKDTKNIYFVTTHFKSFSRKIHMINICSGRKKVLTYEVMLLKGLDEAKTLINKKESKKAEKDRKKFITSHDLVKDKILQKVLEEKIKRNKAKSKSTLLVKRRKELEKALKFVNSQIETRMNEKKKRIGGEDDE